MSNKNAKMRASLKKARSILRGINCMEDQKLQDGAVGWWETSLGADFGEKKLCEVENLIREIYEKDVK